jgi:hypothetical protein
VGGIEVWRVGIIRTSKPGARAEIEIKCGGASEAETLELLKRAVYLLEIKKQRGDIHSPPAVAPPILLGDGNVSPPAPAAPAPGILLGGG